MAHETHCIAFKRTAPWVTLLLCTCMVFQVPCSSMWWSHVRGLGSCCRGQVGGLCACVIVASRWSCAYISLHGLQDPSGNGHRTVMTRWKDGTDQKVVLVPLAKSTEMECNFEYKTGFTHSTTLDDGEVTARADQQERLFESLRQQAGNSKLLGSLLAPAPAQPPPVVTRAEFGSKRGEDDSGEDESLQHGLRRGAGHDGHAAGGRCRAKGKRAQRAAEARGQSGGGAVGGGDQQGGRRGRPQTGVQLGRVTRGLW